MSDVTQMLAAIDRGDPHAADQLLPLVYAELRRLAAAKMSQEKPGHTLEATALVHEAYVRLVGEPGVRDQESGVGPENTEIKNLTPVSCPQSPAFDSRGHFFAAAAEAMRRILVESARRKSRLKRGGDLARGELIEQAIGSPVPAEELLAVDEALEKLEAANRQAAELVKLRYFAGFTIPEAADKMGISPRKANQVWTYARAWLASEITDSEASKPKND